MQFNNAIIACLCNPSCEHFFREGPKGTLHHPLSYCQIFSCIEVGISVPGIGILVLPKVKFDTEPNYRMTTQITELTVPKVGWELAVFWYFEPF